MSAAVPSSRRITGGLLKGYFIRTSSSYPAYPREFPAGVRKSFCRSPFVLSTGFAVVAPSTSLVYSAENSRRREARAPRYFSLEWFAENESAAEKPHLRRCLTTMSYVMKIFSPSIYFCVRPSAIFRNANLISGRTRSRMALFLLSCRFLLPDVARRKTAFRQ